MSKKSSRLSSLVPVVAGALLAACNSVPRENILAGINSTIGVSFAQNQQTQAYEAKIGYIRSQTYSIPTGKTILNNSEEADAASREAASPEIYSWKTSNAADTTPEVLSAIKMKAGVEQLLIGLEVSELFAVGEKAVGSPAAAALFISNATSAENAKQAAESTQAIAGAPFLKTGTAEDVRQQWVIVAQAVYDGLVELAKATPPDLKAKALVDELDKLYTLVPIAWRFDIYEEGDFETDLQVAHAARSSTPDDQRFTTVTQFREALGTSLKLLRGIKGNSAATIAGAGASAAEVEKKIEEHESEQKRFDAALARSQSLADALRYISTGAEK